MKNSFFLILIIIFISVIFIPRSALAEIATTKDWIGLFAITNPPQGDRKADTVNGTSWAYTSNCAQATPGPTAVPKLSDSTGCNIIPNPLPTSGTYEYRMYADDQETPNALIAKSREITAEPTPGPTAGSGSGGIPCPNQSPYPRVQNGLITTPQGANNFGNSSGQCVIDNQASFAPYKIPSYEDLKSMYYTQAKTISGIVTKVSSPASLPINLNENKLYHFTGDLTISSPSDITGPRTGVIFVNQNLTISNDITTPPGSPNAGIVFVVSGDIIIKKTVTQIDAVLIAGGHIYTAVDTVAGETSCNHLALEDDTDQLVVNGSLISLDGNDNIEFCRTLGPDDSTTPAEQINNQPKYLVILRNLMSDTWQKWSEIQ